MKIINKSNYKKSRTKKDRFEENKGKSVVVRDDSYSMRDIMQKFANGMQLDVLHRPIYDGEDVTHDDIGMETIKKADLVEVDQFTTQLSLKNKSIGELYGKLKHEDDRRTQERVKKQKQLDKDLAEFLEHKKRQDIKES